MQSPPPRVGYVATLTLPRFTRLTSYLASFSQVNCGHCCTHLINISFCLIWMVEMTNSSHLAKQITNSSNFCAYAILVSINHRLLVGGPIWLRSKCSVYVIICQFNTRYVDIQFVYIYIYIFFVSIFYNNPHFRTSPSSVSTSKRSTHNELVVGRSNRRRSGKYPNPIPIFAPPKSSSLP